MRRFFTLLCALLVILGAAGTPYLSAQARTNPLTITVWTYYIGEQKRAFDTLVTEFNNTVGYEQGIVVEAQSQGGVTPLAEAVSASVHREPGSEPAPDLFMAYADSAFPLAQEGFLVPFDEYLTEESMDTFVPDFLGEGDILGDGHIYLLPIAKSTEVLVINQTAVDAFFAGAAQTEGGQELSMSLFETWEGIVTLSKAYFDWTEESRGAGRPFFGLDSAFNFLSTTYAQKGETLMWAEGGTGIVHLSSPIFAEAWGLYTTQMASGAFTALGRFSSDDLKTGDILAFLGSSASAAYVQSEVVGEDGLPYEAELTVLPMPCWEQGVPVAIQQGAGFALLRTDAEREAACAVFADWFTQSERNSTFAYEASYLPVRKDALTALGQRLEGTDLSLVEQAQAAAIAQTETFRMIVGAPFEQAFQARSILDGLKEEAKAMALEVQEATATGVPLDEAVAGVTSEEHRADFVAQSTQALEALGVRVE